MSQSLLFNKIAAQTPATLSKKTQAAQVFPCEFCKISKNTFSTERLQKTFSGIYDEVVVVKCI